MFRFLTRELTGGQEAIVRNYTHSVTDPPLSFGGAENDTCNEVDESMTETASLAGITDKVTPVPYSSVSAAVIGERDAGLVSKGFPSPTPLDAETRTK